MTNQTYEKPKNELTNFGFNIEKLIKKKNRLIKISRILLLCSGLFAILLLVNIILNRTPDIFSANLISYYLPFYTSTQLLFLNYEIRKKIKTIAKKIKQGEL